MPALAALYGSIDELEHPKFFALQISGSRDRKKHWMRFRQMRLSTVALNRAMKKYPLRHTFFRLSPLPDRDSRRRKASQSRTRGYSSECSGVPIHDPADRTWKLARKVILPLISHYCLSPHAARQNHAHCEILYTVNSFADKKSKRLYLVLIRVRLNE